MSLGYDLVYGSALVLTSPWWGYRLLRTGKWRTDWAGRFGRIPACPPRRPGLPRLLLHTVSVGETNLVRLLVERLERSDSPWELVISATTNTGIARARQLYADRHAVVRFPLDFGGAVRRFLDAVQPDAVALVENEVWPNFMQISAARGIPVCVINGRLTRRSFSRYRLVGPVARSMYGRLAAAAVQTEEYARHFAGLGVPPQRISILDTMKWDTAQIADQVDGSDQLARDLGIDRSRPLIVGGSTGPGEEKLLMDTCPSQAQLLLVPRKPERFEEVAALDGSMVRRTKPISLSARPVETRKLFLLDTMGELRQAYALADVVIVGRSFRGLGGSDPVEPIALGKATLIGPDHYNFADVVAALRQGGGIEVTDDPGALAGRLLADPQRRARLASAGRQVILSRQGATERHARLLARILAGG